MRHWILASLLLVSPAFLVAQQVPDTAFQPVISKPAFPLQKGPVVLLDEAHFNFHTAAGRYLPFADLLRRDGYVVTPSTKPFTSDLLRTGSVLVISNALNERNQTDWKPPIAPAFTQAEVDTVDLSQVRWHVERPSDHPSNRGGRHIHRFVRSRLTREWASHCLCSDRTRIR